MVTGLGAEWLASLDGHRFSDEAAQLFPRRGTVLARIRRKNLEEEVVYFRRPVLVFDDPDYGFIPPPAAAARPAPPAAKPAPAAAAKPKPCVLPNGQACPPKQ